MKNIDLFNSLSPKILWNKSRIGVKFEGSSLKQEDTALL